METSLVVSQKWNRLFVSLQCLRKSASLVSRLTVRFWKKTFYLVSKDGKRAPQCLHQEGILVTTKLLSWIPTWRNRIKCKHISASTSQTLSMPWSNFWIYPSNMDLLPRVGPNRYQLWLRRNLGTLVSNDLAWFTCLRQTTICVWSSCGASDWYIERKTTIVLANSNMALDLVTKQLMWFIWRLSPMI